MPAVEIPHQTSHQTSGRERRDRVLAVGAGAEDVARRHQAAFDRRADAFAEIDGSEPRGVTSLNANNLLNTITIHSYASTISPARAEFVEEVHPDRDAIEPSNGWHRAMLSCRGSSAASGSGSGA